MKQTKLWLVLLSVSLLVAACGNDQPEISPIPTQKTIEQTATLAPTPTATEVPPLVLNVCMAEEPAGLYRYDGFEGRGKRSVFAAIYVDLLEVNPETKQSLFFESIPTQENGGILLQAVPVRVGQPVLDATGKVVYLAEGTKIEHAINYSTENPVTWNFEQEYQMNQFTVTFKLQPELKWSDGDALLAEDFVFSYHLAERSGLGHYQWALERTDSLIATDEYTLVWTGIPGFVPRDLDDILWQPLPSHQLSEFSDHELLTSDLTTRNPLGWGAYQLAGWNAGSQIVLDKNPNFVLAGQGVPAYDQLIFHIEPNLDAALQKLESGQCDILDKTYQLEGMGKSQLETLAANNKLVVEDWQPVQQLVFGIKPVTFDDGMYNAWTSTRQDLFGSLQTRQAIAACIDANSLVSEYLAEHLPQDLVPVNENMSANSPDVNNAYLEEIGWVLTNDDSGVMRRAQGVPNVLEGHPLAFGIYLGESQLDQDIAEEIVNRLSRCNIPVARQSAPLSELYKPGPEGPLFGRNFDMALVSWKQEHSNNCQLYTSDQVPSSINSWVGTNIAGFSSVDFDEACYRASTRLPLESETDDAALMAEYLPAIPLMPQYRIWAASNRVNLSENAKFESLWLFTPAQ
jgi:peptide/nickel transport system substrate-binding protein